jgi:hypothetical protein
MEQAHIAINTDHRRGIWTYEFTRFAERGRQIIRNAGSLPTEAHTHTLAIVALTSALRSITNAQRKELMTQGRTAKPTVKVVTRDATLAAALQNAAQLNAGGNFLDVFSKQARRFDLRVVAEPVNARLKALLNWATWHVPDPKKVAAADAAFAPIAASEMV